MSLIEGFFEYNMRSFMIIQSNRHSNFLIKILERLKFYFISHICFSENDKNDSKFIFYFSNHAKFL